MKSKLTTLCLTLCSLGILSNSWSSCLDREYLFPLAAKVTAVDVTGNEPEIDSTPFAKVIIYRPDNQLSRSYHFKTGLNHTFSLKKQQEMTMDAHSEVLELVVRATGHKSERQAFRLSKDKVHYFRVQDRNNYSGFRPLLEIIEVEEATYRKDMVRI